MGLLVNRRAPLRGAAKQYLVSLRPAFFGEATVVLLQQIVVFAHELNASIGVHFLAEGFRKMAPNVLV